MKKIFTAASIIFCFSTACFATSATIRNNNPHGNLTVTYQECARPIVMDSQDHLDCLPGAHTITLPGKTSSSITIDPGYFANITQAVDKNKAGHTRAETHYNEQNRCELFSSIILLDNGAGRILCA